MVDIAKKNEPGITRLTITLRLHEFPALAADMAGRRQCKISQEDNATTGKCNTANYECKQTIIFPYTACQRLNPFFLV